MEIKIKKENEENNEFKSSNRLMEDFDMPVISQPEIRGHNMQHGTHNMEHGTHEPDNFDKSDRIDKSYGADGSHLSERMDMSDMSKEISDVRISHGLSQTIMWWKQISRWSLLAMIGLAPIFFLPVTQLPVAVNKEIFVFGAILVALFAYLGRVLVEGKFRYPGHLLTSSLAVLIIAWFLSSFFSVNSLASFIGTWSSFDSFASIVLFSVLAYLVAASFDRRDLVMSVLIFLGGLAVLGVFEILQFFRIFILPWSFAKTAVFSTVGTINELGLTFAFGLILGVGMLASLEISSLLKKFLAASVLVFLINLLFINFIFIWIGAALSMIVLISFFSAGLKTMMNKESDHNSSSMIHDSDYGQGLQLIYFRKAWLPTVILLLAMLFIFIPSPLAQFVNVPPEVGLSHKATFNITLKNIKSSKALLGSGPNTFWHDYALNKPESINNTIFWSTNFSQGASVIATWLNTVGVLGVLAILFLIAVFFWTGLKTGALKQSTRSITNVLAQASFVGVFFMFVMWFLYNTNFTNMALTFWGIGLFLASSLYFSHESGETQKRFKEIALFTSPQKTFLLSLLVVALMTASVAAVYGEVKRYGGEYYFSKALEANAARNTTVTIDNLTKAINFWGYDERYWQSLGQATFVQLNALFAEKNITQEVLRARFQSITSSAIQAAKKAGELNPINPFNSMLLGSIYENIVPLGVASAGDFSIQSYSKAISLDPKNPANYVAVARVYVAQADLIDAQMRISGASNDLIQQRDAIFAKAELHLVKALELKNDFTPARFLLVQVFDREGKIVDAINRAFEIAQFNPDDVGSLFQLGFLYYKNGQFSESRIVLERAVGISPNYSNARYFLGLIYDRQGDRDSAIIQFVQIENLNPDNAEVKQILANLRAKKEALFGIVPPPQQRTEAPVREGAESPVNPVKRK